MRINCVALRKESVDRNMLWIVAFKSSATSLSARRAWIEIAVPVARRTSTTVALRKENVDRNSVPLIPTRVVLKSLSARRAWIEICLISVFVSVAVMSLSARRAWIEIWTAFLRRGKP